MDEQETITIDAQQGLALFQQLYPTEFAHVMATLEAAYWRAKATEDVDDPAS